MAWAICSCYNILKDINSTEYLPSKMICLEKDISNKNMLAINDIVTLLRNTGKDGGLAHVTETFLLD